MELRTELVRYVRRRVEDESAADDLVHDVLLRALRELDGPAPPAHLRGWLYRATRNAIVDRYRARRPAAELPAELSAPEPESEASAERELAPCLAPLVATLEPPYRRALELAEIDGLPQRELAARESISLSGAKSRVQRARAKLRAALLACCQVEFDRRGAVIGYESASGCALCAAGTPSPSLASKPKAAAQPGRTGCC